MVITNREYGQFKKKKRMYFLFLLSYYFYTNSLTGQLDTTSAHLLVEGLLLIMTCWALNFLENKERINVSLALL